MSSDDHMNITMDGGEGKPKIEGTLEVNVTNADAVEAARQLAEAMKALSERFDALTKKNDRQKHIIWGIIVSVSLDVVLSVIALIGLHSGSVANHNALVATQSNRATALASCQNSNKVRMSDIHLWDFILNWQSATGMPTTSSAAEKVAIQNEVNKTFKQVNCQALVSKTPTTTSTTTSAHHAK
jgi:hypothetical protein